MRMSILALLAAIALVTTSEATISPKTAILPTSSVTVESHTTNRFLRAATIADQDDEDRVLPAIKKLARADAFNKKAELLAKHQTWIAKGMSVDDAFNAYKLQNKGRAIFGSDDVVDWAKFVKIEAGKENVGVKVLESLQKQYSDFVLARMIQSATTSSNPRVSKLATKVQTAQFTKWKNNLVGLKDVKKNLNAQVDAEAWSTVNRDLVKAYEIFRAS
ncbi:hypothetical protein L917_05583 [Phytophthora nicotianae]|uniref:RxLR effector protein n=1 Tax=Phytophthora nicotianae TaxID=4792 RepID=W2LI33_PHYNI|nr:hypothetical protein L917_05583 [Phytophthora nicotianae]